MDIALQSSRQKPLDLQSSDAWLLLVLGSMSFCLSLLLVLGFIKYNKLRDRPGDIIFMISLSGLFLSLHWVVSALFSDYFFGDLSNNYAFCWSNALVSVFFGSLTYSYNIGFCVYLVTSLRNALKDSRIPNKSLHLVCAGGPAIFVIYKAFTNGLGKSLYGTCSFKFEKDINRSLLTGATKYILLVFFYFAFSFYTYWYIKSRLPKNLNSRSMRKSKVFLNHYINYLIANSVIWLVIGLSYVLGIAFPPNDDCYSPETKTARAIASVGNAAKMLYISVVLYIRFTDPLIARTMKRVVFFCKKRRRDALSEAWTESRSRLGSIVSEIDEKDLLSVNKHRDSSVYLKEPLLQSSCNDGYDRTATHVEIMLSNGFTNAANELANDLKIQTTITILSCVLYSYKCVIEEDVHITIPQLLDDPEGFHRPKKFQVSESMFPGISTPLLDGTFMFYCPYVFHHLLRQDAEFLNVIESLDLEANLENIKKASGADGGRSGEFFFFSKDNKIIVKTMTEKELKKMLEVLPQYTQYMEQNPKSLIAKIYGVFTFRREFDPNPQHFFMMRNATGVPSSFIPRKYDTKGSTVDREVLVGRHFVQKQFINEKKTLKDIDFLNYEKKIYVSEALSKSLREMLEQDADFLSSLRLMDYSLVIFIIDKKKITEELGGMPMSARYHELCSLDDTEDSDLVYNLAIIDYLQEYDCGKVLENRYKRSKAAVFKCVWRLDISSQPPEVYARRFKSFVRNIVG